MDLVNVSSSEEKTRLVAYLYMSRNECSGYRDMHRRKIIQSVGARHRIVRVDPQKVVPFSMDGVCVWVKLMNFTTQTRNRVTMPPPPAFAC